MGLLGKKSDSESSARMSREVIIVNRLGLHARPAAMFVKTTNQHKAEVWVEKDGEEINGKSIMGLMMLAAGQGSKMTISAEGPDAEEVLDAIEALVASKFNED